MASAARMPSTCRPADLAFGAHTVTWSATDLAGNHRDGFWTFRVVDAVPPALSGARTAGRGAAASCAARRSPSRSPTTAAASIRRRCTCCSTGQRRGAVRHADRRPLRLRPGGRPRRTATTRSAFPCRTATATRWRRSSGAFDVIDTTPPVLGDVRPDDGSAGADRTPAISFAVVRRGHRLDPASISLTVDGRDVTARGVLAGGRFALRAGGSALASAATASPRAPPTDPGNVSAAAHLVVPGARRDAARDRPALPAAGIHGGGGDADRVRGRATTARASTTTRCG